MSKLFAGAIALALFAAAAVFIASSARAEIVYPWCAEYGGGREGIGATNCGFVSLEQCRATVRGIGGFCNRNPAYPGRGHKPIKIRRPRPDYD